MSGRRALLAVAALLAAGFFAGAARLFTLRFESGDIYPPYSSLRADPLGAMALYESLAALPGASAARHMKPLESAPAGGVVFYTGVAPWTLRFATGKQLAPTPFVFTASRPFIDIRTWDEHVAADVHKHTIALTWNYAAEAVLACPAPEAESEHVWTPDAQAVPEPPSPATLYVSKSPRAEWE